MRVAAYTRVSTEGQCGEDRFGLEVQKAQIQAYADRHDMVVVKWFTDEGESGAKERPGFDSIVFDDEVSNPPYEAVLVAKSDRVARDINVYYYYKMMLRKKGVTLISIAEDFGSYGVFASMLEAFTLCVAEMERENITKRTSAGRRAKARKGGYAGGRPPMGYRAAGGQWEIVPEEAETVRRVFYLSDEEGLSVRGVCARLEEEGHGTRGGGRFAPATVHSILRNRLTYEGMYRYGGSDWIMGEHEPILIIADECPGGRKTYVY